MVLLATAFALLGQSPPTFQILGEDLKGKEIFAYAASPNGKAILAWQGPYDAPVPWNLIIRNQPIAIVGEDITVMPRVPAGTAAIAGIFDSGELLGNGINASGRGPLAYYPFVWNGRDFHAMTDVQDLGDYSSLQATAICRDGSILASASWSRQGGIGGVCAVVRVRDGVGERLFSLDTGGVASPTLVIGLNEFQGGFVGMIPRKRTATSSVSSAAYFEGGGWQLLPLVGTAPAVRPTACSEDGAVVAAVGNGLPVVYRNGSIVSTVVKAPASVGAVLTGASGDGSILVGHQGSTPRTAVIWRPKQGFQPLANLLTEKKVSLPEDWTLVDALYISGDGSRIIGSARNREGKVRPYRLNLPQPKKEESTMPTLPSTTVPPPETWPPSLRVR